MLASCSFQRLYGWKSSLVDHRVGFRLLSWFLLEWNEIDWHWFNQPVSTNRLLVTTTIEFEGLETEFLLGGFLPKSVFMKGLACLSVTVQESLNWWMCFLIFKIR